MKHSFLISASFAVLLAISPAARAQDAATVVMAVADAVEADIRSKTNNGADLSEKAADLLLSLKQDAATAAQLLARTADLNKAADTAKADLVAGQKNISAAEKNYQAQAKQVEIKLDILDGLKNSYRPEEPQKALTEAIAQQKTQEYWFNEAAKAVEKANKEKLPPDHPFRKEAEAGFANAQRLLAKAQTAALLAADVVTDPKNGLAKLQAAQQDLNDAKGGLDTLNAEKTAANQKVTLATAQLNEANSLKVSTKQDLDKAESRATITLDTISKLPPSDLRKPAATSAANSLGKPAAGATLAPDAGKALAVSPGGLQSAANAVAGNGGKIVTQEGGALISQDAGTLISDKGAGLISQDAGTFQGIRAFRATSTGSGTDGNKTTPATTAPAPNASTATAPAATATATPVATAAATAGSSPPQGSAKLAATSTAPVAGAATAPPPVAASTATSAATATPLTADSQAFGRLAVMATDPELKNRLGNMGNGQKTLGELVAVLQSGKQLSSSDQQKVQAMWTVSTYKMAPTKLQGLDQQANMLGSAAASSKAAHVDTKAAFTTAVVQQAVQTAKNDPVVASAAQKLTTNQTLTPAETKSLNTAVAKTVNTMNLPAADKKALSETAAAHVTTLVTTNAAATRTGRPTGNAPGVGTAGSATPSPSSQTPKVDQLPKTAVVTPPQASTVTAPASAATHTDPKTAVQPPPRAAAVTPPSAPAIAAPAAVTTTHTEPKPTAPQPPKAAAVAPPSPPAATVHVDPKPVVQQQPKVVTITPPAAPVQAAKPAPVVVAPVKPPTITVVAKPPVVQAAPPPPPPAPKPPSMCGGKPC